MRGNPHVRFFEGPGPATVPVYSTATGRTMGPKLAERLRTYDVDARALDPAWMVRDLPEPVPEGFDLTDWSEAVP